MMNPVKISAVSYLNTYPFVYGLLHSGLMDNFRLELDVPAVCAAKLKNGDADIALIPVGAITDFDYVNFVSEYCIAAENEVRTVLLLSKSPLKQIKKIHLDPHSRTSVKLARVLSEKYWKINPVWEDIRSWSEPLDEVEAVVAIGDKTFMLRNEFPYVFDLAEEWIKFTSLPFVFAAWLSVEKQPASVVNQLNSALKYGVEHIEETIRFFNDKLPTTIDDAMLYLQQNISYNFDLKKKKGLEKFLGLSGRII